MPKKLTIEDIQKTAQERGGKCLSSGYKNAKEKLLWECASGHRWEASADNIRSSKSWCPHCAGVSRNTLTEAKTLANSRGGKCLSNAYKNNRTLMEWECGKGHRWEATWKSVANLESWCPHCAGNAPLTLEDMQEMAESRGGKCISETYKNVSSLMEWECSEGHAFQSTPDNIKRGRWCPECYSSVGERICRTAFKQLFDSPFPKSYPEWLVSEEGNQLELDGYNEELGIAFEHHGTQHFSFQGIFHDSLVDFQRQQSRDEIKRGLCAQKGVTLVEVPEIPSLLKLEDVRGYILEELSKQSYAVSDRVKVRSVDYKEAYVSSRETLALIELKERVHSLDSGGRILSDRYINAHTKLKLECSKGHRWEATPASIKAGKWCRKCSGYAKLTLADMVEAAKNHGGKCLSKTYVNNSTHLEWECSKGHRWEAVPSSIRSGSWCPYCSGVVSLPKEVPCPPNLPTTEPPLTTLQKAVISSTLICGGRVEEVSPTTARMVQTTRRDKEWLRWKAEVLKPFGTLVEGEQGRTRLLTCSSEQFLEFRGVYSSSSNQKGRRYVPYNLFSPWAKEPLFLLTWYLEGRWSFDCTDVLIPTLNSYSREDIKRLCKILRDMRLRPTSEVGGTIRLGDQAFEVRNRLEKVLEDYNIRFITLPEIQAGYDTKDITPETVAKLHHVFGMSFKEIGDLYGLSKATCWRRANACTQDLSCVQLLGIQEAASLLKDIETEGWTSLDEEAQDKVVEMAVSILEKTPFPYPTPLAKEEVHAEFSKLRHKELHLTSDKEIRPDTLYGLSICRPYFLNRYRAVYLDRMSCLEAWFNKEELRRAVKFQLRYGSSLVPRRIRKALQANLRTPTIFKPGIAKYVYQTYAPEGGVVYDPCAGYGGRMVGALASGLRYIATDVEEETIGGNQKLADTLGLSDKVSLYCEPAETFEIPEEVDVVFTSPPYFDREKYSESGDQSWVRHEELEGWLEGFLRPVIRNSYRALRNSGTFAMNICDIRDRYGKKVPLESEMFRLALEEGFDPVEMLKMPLSNLSPRDYEPIFVFRKS